MIHLYEIFRAVAENWLVVARGLGEEAGGRWLNGVDVSFRAMKIFWNLTVVIAFVFKH